MALPPCAFVPLCETLFDLGFHKLFETLVGVIPRRRLPGPVFLNFEAGADDFSRLGDAANGALSYGLRDDVANCGGFDRAGHNAAIGGVGGHLAKQRVLGTTADDVNRLDAIADQFFEESEHHPIAERKAF